MALQENISTLTYAAGGVVEQYRLVAQGSTARTVAHAAAAALAVGATLNKATAAGQALTVACGGIVKVEAGEAIDPGEVITAGTAGVAAVATTGDVAFGVAVTGGASGEIIEVHALGAWIAL